MGVYLGMVIGDVPEPRLGQASMPTRSDHYTIHADLVCAVLVCCARGMAWHGMACCTACPPPTCSPSSAHGSGLVLVHGAKRVAPSRAEQARLRGDHRVALVPRSRQPPSPRFRPFLQPAYPRAHSCPCILIPKAMGLGYSNGGPWVGTQLFMHGSGWTLRVVKEQQSGTDRSLREIWGPNGIGSVVLQRGHLPPTLGACPDLRTGG